MFGARSLNNNSPIVSVPDHFKNSARLAIYKQLLPSFKSSQSSTASSDASLSVQSAPAHYNGHGLASLFSRRRSVRLAPSLFSTSTATIPEHLEQVSVTVDQFVNDIALHEKHFQKAYNERKLPQAEDAEDIYKISLGSDIEFHNTPEYLVDWNLNVTRCRMMLIHLPMVSSVPQTMYSEHELPQLVGDLSQRCHIVLIQPHMTDKELIKTLEASNLYCEHDLDPAFKKSVADVSVKQSRLLQMSQAGLGTQEVFPLLAQSYLQFKFKCIAIRNYLVNLAAAAATAHEYKEQLRLRKLEPNSQRLSKDEKKALWSLVRQQVFERAGLE